jgi:hypothetical protein
MAYLSPEQVRGLELDARSDVFALGVVLWEMLAGQRLFAGDNEFQTLRNVLTLPVPPPSSKRAEVPAALDRIVARALERDRAARYPSAAALAEELTAVVGAAGEEGIAALLATLFGERAAVPHMTGSFTVDSLVSLDSEPVRTTGERRALAELIADVDGAPPPPAPPVIAPSPVVALPVAARPVMPPPVVAATPRRRRALVAGAVLIAALALGAVCRLGLSRAAPDPSRRADTASAGR